MSLVLAAARKTLGIEEMIRGNVCGMWNKYDDDIGSALNKFCSTPGGGRAKKFICKHRKIARKIGKGICKFKVPTSLYK